MDFATWLFYDKVAKRVTAHRQVMKPVLPLQLFRRFRCRTRDRFDAWVVYYFNWLVLANVFVTSFQQVHVDSGNPVLHNNVRPVRHISQ